MFSQRSIWGKMDHEVLPYHWDDRQKLYHDYQYLDRLYEEVLSQLSERLNALHQRQYSVRYWRIVLGPWLYYFIQILFDRYNSIVTAENSGRVTNTLITGDQPERWVPRDFSQFAAWYLRDDYNQYLYGRIIEANGRLAYEKVSVRSAVHCKKRSSKLVKTIKLLLRKTLAHCSRWLPAGWRRIIFVGPYMRRSDLVRLQLSLGLFPFPFPVYFDPPEAEVDWQKRKGLELKIKGGEFEALLCSLLQQQMPSCYVESYQKMEATAGTMFPPQPKVIFNTIAHEANEAFKVWTADQVERGTKLVGFQHGGTYGSGLWLAQEDHEYRISDKYISWGWDDAGRDRIKALPAVKLNDVQRLRPNKKGKLLLVTMAIPRYSYLLYSIPVGASGYNAYLADLFAFIRGLAPAAAADLNVRLYPIDYELGQRERFAAEFPELKIVPGRETMHRQLSQSRLFIGTYNSTTHLETLAANYPTVIFWDPQQWELRAAAKPYYEQLRKVGILYDSPEAAAKFVNAISADPSLWWQKPEVQEARRTFCRQFAYLEADWLPRWKTELSRLALN